MGNSQIDFLDLKDSNSAFKKELEEAALRVIRSGRYLHSEETHKLEENLKELSGAGHAVGVSNGLDAIKLILRAYLELGRLKPGDEVMVPANSFIASALPVSDLGLTLKLVDPSEKDFNLDLEEISRMVSDQTKAVILVHLYGTPTWDSEAAEKLRRQGILIIEDNAQALGAEASEAGFSGSRMAGALGDAAAVSFYPTKNIGALGDAGAVLTSDVELAETIRALANYGSNVKYHYDRLGYNCRIDEIQAAFLNVKLPHIFEIRNQRQETAKIYDSILNDIEGLQVPRIFPERKQMWHQYVIRTQRRDELKKYLETSGVSTDIHYPVGIHMQQCYADLPHEPLPIATAMASDILSLPIANVSKHQAIHIADTIKTFFKG